MSVTAPEALLGTIVADETYIGGEPGRMNAKGRLRAEYDPERQEPVKLGPRLPRRSQYTAKMPVLTLINTSGKNTPVSKVLLSVQIVIADVVFFIYAVHGIHWDIPTVAISAWLGEPVVQVLGVVAIVVKGIFPAESADFHSPGNRASERQIDWRTVPRDAFEGYDEPVNIDMDPEEALKLLLGQETSEGA